VSTQTPVPYYRCVQHLAHQPHGWVNHPYTNDTTGCPGVPAQPGEHLHPPIVTAHTALPLALLDEIIRDYTQLAHHRCLGRCFDTCTNDDCRHRRQLVDELRAYLPAQKASTDEDPVDPCGDVCHPEHGACCGGRPRPAPADKSWIEMTNMKGPSNA